MTDKELLELAAKAAGIKVRWHDNWKCFVHVKPYNTDNPPTVAGSRIIWIPLTDDGDALRLAVKLGCQLVINPEIGITDCKIGDGDWCFGGEHHHPDPYSATRRAIVRAAAEIGRTK